MPNCRRKLKCQGVSITGDVYFLVHQGQKIEHCPDCAAEVLRPSINSDLKDVRTLINTFGPVMDLKSLGGMREEEVDGQTKTKVYGWLGGVTAAFKRRQLWPAMSSGRTLLGEAQYLVAENLLTAIGRMLPHASGFHKKKVERQLNHAKAKFEEAKAHRTAVQEFRNRNVMVPKNERKDFFSSAKEAYQNAKTVVMDLAPSLRSQKQRALLGPEDVKLLDILLKGVEELKSKDQQPEESTTGDSSPSGTEVSESGQSGVEDQESPIQAIVALPNEVRIIQPGKRVAAPKKEQDRARKLLKEHGGLLDLSWGPASNGKKQKIVKLSGCETDPEAAKAAMLAKVKE